jgi:hypothetical protein
MFAVWVSFRDGPTDAVIKILIQGFYESLLHARVGFANLVNGKGIGASTDRDHEPVLRKLADAPVIAHHVEHSEEVRSYLGYTFQLSRLSHIHADAAAEVLAHFPNEVESTITESLIHGLVKTTKALHVAMYGPMTFLFRGESFELQLLGQSHVISPNPGACIDCHLSTLRQTLRIC